MEAEQQPIVLTERQRRVLWMVSVGKTTAEISREYGNYPRNVTKMCGKIYRALGASTPSHAVRNGLLAGLIGPYEDCGSLAAYRRHIKREEATCAACKRGNRERLEAEASPRQVRLGKPEIQLLRAIDAGRTRAQIATAWGISEQDVRHLITTTYAALGVDRLPLPVRREAALREARTRGFLAPTPPPQQSPPPKTAHLSDTHVKILLSMESGVTLAQTAADLGLRPGTCATRLSEAYRRMDVGWMEKGQRLPAALRKARAMGLVPEPATA